MGKLSGLPAFCRAAASARQRHDVVPLCRGAVVARDGLLVDFGIRVPGVNERVGRLDLVVNWLTCVFGRLPATLVLAVLLAPNDEIFLDVTERPTPCCAVRTVDALAIVEWVPFCGQSRA